MKRVIKITLFVSLLISLQGYSQTYFSKRLSVAGKVNLTGSLKLFTDTFFIPTWVIEQFGPAKYSVSLLKVSNTGSIIAQKRFKPANVNYSGGNDLYIRNNKFYVPSITSYGYDLRAGFFVFDKNCDTIFTKNIGDTAYYNSGDRILPYKKTKDKLLIFGVTDSTCGVNHPGLYKPIIRVVDTNGVLTQTKLYMTTNKYRGVLSADTTINKGYIFCGGEFQTFFDYNFIIKLDSNLNLEWLKYLDTTSVSYSAVVSSKRAGYYFTTTHVDSCYTCAYGYERVALSRLDGNGNVIWRKLYGTKAQAVGATNVKELSNGDILVCGFRPILYSPTVGQQVGFIMRTDSSGNIKWWNNYIPTSPLKDTAGQCYLYDILEMPDKGFAAVGWVGGDGGLGTIQESWLLRVDSMGCLLSGCSTSSGIAEINNVASVLVYPNPTNGKIIIETSNYSDGIYIKITDILGREFKIEELILGKTEIDLSFTDSGIYFLNFYYKTKLLYVKKIVKQ